MNSLNLHDIIRQKNLLVYLVILISQVFILFISIHWGIDILIGLIAVLILLVVPLISLELSLATLLFCFIYLNRPLTAHFVYKGILLQDIFFLIVIAVWIFRRILDGRFLEYRSSLLTNSYTFFLATGCIAALLGIYNLNRFNNIFYEMRELMYFLTFFIAVDVVRKRRQIYLIFGSFFLATNLFALESIVGSVMQTKLIMMSLGQLRYVEPTSFFLSLGIVFNMSYLLFAKLRRLYQFVLLVSTVLLGTALTLSLTRGYWLGLAGGLFFIFLLLPRQRKLAVLVMSIGLIFFGVFAASVFIGFSPKLIFDIVGSRALSMRFFSYDTSAMARIEEIRSILREMPKFPLFGKGLGASLYLFKYDKGVWSEWIYFHNNYFEILLKMGLLGLCAYLVKVFSFFKMGFASLKTKYDPEKACIIAILAMYGAAMVTSLTSGVVLFLDTAPFIGITMGLIVLIYGKQIIEWEK